MSEELSGRNLEIATARALGFHVELCIDGDDYTCYSLKDGEQIERWHGRSDDAWSEGAPSYLTDPVAFASVLAALDAVGTTWSIESSAVGTGITSRAMIAGWIERDAATYQEAMCRCFVAWKQP